MKKLILIFVISMMQMNICLADNEIKLSTPEEIDLLKKDWECDWISSGNPNIFNGKYLLSIENTSATVSRNFENTFCSDPKKFTG